MKINSFFLLLSFIYLVSCRQNKKMTKTSEHQFTNELINETSPYLLQHAHNPVNW